MAFEPRRLNQTLKKKLDAFLGTQNLSELYRAYAWRNDTHIQGFPDIFSLETRLVKMAQTYGISLEDVKCVAKWGGLPLGRIKGEDVVLPALTLHTATGSPLPALGDAPLKPLLTLIKTITRGIGPTYFSKILRFGLPQEYGAIDTRCIRTFGQREGGLNWLALYALYGNRWYIPAAQAGWPNEYGKWINILRYFASHLPDNCPHPKEFVTAGLRKSGIWECADVEMALFSYASQVMGSGRHISARPSC